MSNKLVTNADIFDRQERLRLELTKLIQDSSRDHKAIKQIHKHLKIGE